MWFLDSQEAAAISLGGSIAFSLAGNLTSAFFPQAGQLPENPCTVATDDQGRWTQAKKADRTTLKKRSQRKRSCLGRRSVCDAELPSVTVSNAKDLEQQS